MGIREHFHLYCAQVNKYAKIHVCNHVDETQFNSCVTHTPSDKEYEEKPRKYILMWLQPLHETCCHHKIERMIVSPRVLTVQKSDILAQYVAKRKVSRSYVRLAMPYVVMLHSPVRNAHMTAYMSVTCIISDKSLCRILPDITVGHIRWSLISRYEPTQTHGT